MCSSNDVAPFLLRVGSRGIGNSVLRRIQGPKLLGPLLSILYKVRQHLLFTWTATVLTLTILCPKFNFPNLKTIHCSVAWVPSWSTLSSPLPSFLPPNGPMDWTYGITLAQQVLHSTTPSILFLCAEKESIKEEMNCSLKKKKKNRAGCGGASL